MTRDPDDSLRSEITWAVSMLEDALKKQWDAEHVVRERRIQLYRELERAHAARPEQT